MSEYSVNRLCKVCRDIDHREIVDAKCFGGVSYKSVSAHLKEVYQVTIAAATIAHHWEHRAAELRAMAESRGFVGKRDLAEVVRNKTLDAVERGDLDVTDKMWKNVTPGLQAQALIDRRESKTDDRKMLLTLAMLLSGGSITGEIAGPPERLLLGDGEDVEEVEFVELEA